MLIQKSSRHQACGRGMNPPLSSKDSEHYCHELKTKLQYHSDPRVQGFCKKKLEGTGSELQAVAPASPLRENDGHNDNDDNDTLREDDPTNS